MGGAWIGMARGHEALFLNPANLGLPDSPRWSVALLQVSAGAAVAGLPLEDVADLVRFDDLSDAERDRLFSAVPASGLAGDLSVRAPLATLQVGPFAAGVAYTALGDHAVSRDLVELFLYGYEEGRTDYRVAGTAGQRATLWDFALGYGAAAGPLSWGVAAHYLRGGTLVRSWASEPRIDLAGRDIEVSYNGVLSRGGNGFGLDLGVAYQPMPTLTLSAAVANAYGRMDWSDDLIGRQLVLRRADFEDAEALDLVDRYEDSERDLGPEGAGGVTADRLQDESYLPTTATFGVAWRAASRTHLSASFAEDVTDGRLAGSWTRTAALGIQQRIPLVTLRAGVAGNLDGGSLLSGGLSLGPLDLGVARLRDEAADGESRSGWIAVFGLGVRTPETRVPASTALR